MNGLSRVFQDPQVVARGLQIAMPHPAAGSLPLVASPMALSETPVQYRRPPPTLGEHTAEVLGELLGVAAAELETLRAASVIG